VWLSDAAIKVSDRASRDFRLKVAAGFFYLQKEAWAMSIKDRREEIDAIDQELLRLLNARAAGLDIRRIFESGPEIFCEAEIFQGAVSWSSHPGS
jgi:hypothetical protein